MAPSPFRDGTMQITTTPSIDGKRITTGGSLPTLDLMLELIRRRHGYSLALEVSRQFIYEQGGVSSNATAMPSTGSIRLADPRVSQAMRVMEEHLELPLPLVRLARRIGISERRLQTLFIEAIGAPPHIHYLALRLNAARRKVIETRIAFADIAATYDTKVLESAKTYSDALKGAFDVIKDGLETFDRLRGSDIVVPESQLRAFEGSAMGRPESTKSP